MEEQIKKGVDSWLEFMELRYKTEKSFLDVLDKNDIQLGNGAINELIANGVKFSRAFMETRYKLERELVGTLSNIDTSIKKKGDSGVTIAKDEEGKVPRHAGLIRVIIPQGGTIEIPISLKNEFEKEQQIEVLVSQILNLETSKSVSGELEVAESNFKIQPNSTSTAKISFTANGRIFKPGKNYAARVEIHGFEQKSLDLFISVVEKGKAQNVTFEQSK